MAANAERRVQVETQKMRVSLLPGPLPRAVKGPACEQKSQDSPPEYKRAVSIFVGQSTPGATQMADDGPARHRPWYIDFKDDRLRLSELTFTKNVIFVNRAASEP